MKEMPAYMNTPYLKNNQYHEMNSAMGNPMMGGHQMQMTSTHPNMMPQQQYMSYPQSTNGYIPPTAMPDVSYTFLANYIISTLIGTRKCFIARVTLQIRNTGACSQIWMDRI